MALESSPEHPQPLRVVTTALRGYIDRLGPVWVQAQLIELNRRDGNRLVFLTLRDTLAEVSVNVTISPATLAAAGPLDRGATVVARLKANYYEPAGRLSFACDQITAIGEGRLLARIEQTRRLLQAEGLFDPARKRRLPFLPRAIGLITASGSAAERDVTEHTRRRWPAARIVVRHVLVQGQQAAEQIMLALRILDAETEVEVIVVARGGGSVEDLLPFSDEGLVRAVAACRTPVVSAIGHESDRPLLDLVADVRASTPTDAAKRIVPDVTDERLRIEQTAVRLRHAVLRLVQRQQERLTDLRSRPVLADPTASFAPRYDQLAALRHRARQSMTARLDRERTVVEHTLARVRTLSPRATLDRGYALVLAPDGTAISSVAAVRPGDEVLAHVTDGQFEATVGSVRPTKQARGTEGEK